MCSCWFCVEKQGSEEDAEVVYLTSWVSLYSNACLATWTYDIFSLEGPLAFLGLPNEDSRNFVQFVKDSHGLLELQIWAALSIVVQSNVLSAVHALYVSMFHVIQMVHLFSKMKWLSIYHT